MVRFEVRERGAPFETVNSFFEAVHQCGQLRAKARIRVTHLFDELVIGHVPECLNARLGSSNGYVIHDISLSARMD